MPADLPLQPVGNQLDGLTLRHVAELLGLSRTAIEKRRNADLPHLAGLKPAQIATDDALAAFDQEMQQLRGRLGRMIAVHEGSSRSDPFREIMVRFRLVRPPNR